jgi:hypothetical protein
MTTIRNKYIGITHPLEDAEALLKSKDFIESWKQSNCRYGMHLFDEVWSDESHYLHCDVCGVEVHIKEVVVPDGKDDIIE